MYCNHYASLTSDLLVVRLDDDRDGTSSGDGMMV